LLRRFALKRGLYALLTPSDRRVMDLACGWMPEKWRWKIAVSLLEGIRDKLVALAQAASQLWSQHLRRAVEQGLKRIRAVRNPVIRRILEKWAEDPRFLAYYGTAAP
jgi:hypothetical protein